LLDRAQTWTEQGLRERKSRSRFFEAIYFCTSSNMHPSQTGFGWRRECRNSWLMTDVGMTTMATVFIPS
jgi:hypothetical protein